MTFEKAMIMVLNQDPLDSIPGELQIEPWFETQFKSIPKTDLPEIEGFEYRITGKNELITEKIELHCKDEEKVKKYTETEGV